MHNYKTGKTDHLLNRLAGAYEFLDFNDEQTPVFLSIALPVNSAAIGLPEFPHAAMPASGRTANGRGLTADQSHASCLGEALELTSCCLWDPARLVSASLATLGAKALTPTALSGLTADQRAERAQWNRDMGHFDWRPDMPDGDAVLDWVPVENAYTQEIRYAPADTVYIGRREAGDEQACGIADSNGCACGEDADTARSNALLELVERDAVARWWYGRRGRSIVDPAAMGVAPDFMTYLTERARSVSVFDITTDIDLSAFAAVSADPDRTHVAIGSSCDIDADKAVLSALTEMMQMEFSLTMARQAPGMSPLWDAWVRDVTLDTAPLTRDAETTKRHWSRQSRTIDDRLSVCLEACERRDVELYFADMTWPSIGVPVMRALSPDLCHFKPRFNRSRLLAVDQSDVCRSADAMRDPNPLHFLV